MDTTDAAAEVNSRLWRKRCFATRGTLSALWRRLRRFAAKMLPVESQQGRCARLLIRWARRIRDSFRHGSASLASWLLRRTRPRTEWTDEEPHPLASIIVVTYNNLELNQACLRSIFERTDYPNYEVIVVDNASTDGTPQWLAEAAAGEPRLRVICNGDNRGFAGANNQGLRAARGECLCLLNNDTQVSRGWLATLIGHLRNAPELGAVGPVSNMVGNEAIVPVAYRHIDDMPKWAAQYCRKHDGQTVPINMLGFFCVVMRRAVYEKVGELDERFGLGYFEDDDYCRRIRRQGYELRYARDAFVHHWQGASFRLLGLDRREVIFQENRTKFEAKWKMSQAEAR